MRSVSITKAADFYPCPTILGRWSSAGGNIGRTLVEERLAACVNIIARVRSIYRWEHRVETANEVILIAKSQSDRFDQIENRVKELHPYECPCIVAWPIAVGHQPYLDWLARETSSGT